MVTTYNATGGPAIPSGRWLHRQLLIPALPGTGVIAGNTVRAVVESCGIRDILTKSRGSTNPATLVRATFDALARLRTREEVARLRGVNV